MTIFVPGTGRTYLDLQSRIADDLSRTDLTSQIKENILLAIQNYKHERFWFNEASTTLTATLSSAQVAAPTGILEIDKLYITISSTNIELIQKDLNTIVEYRPTTNGRPLSYAYYGNQFELDRKSDSAYSLPLYYLKELSALSADADTNAWTTDAEDLIVFHAEKGLYANVIKDTEKAATAQAQETAALTQLRARRTGRIATGYTKAVYL